MIRQCIVAFILAATTLAGWTASDAFTGEAPARIVAIGDVHGANEHFIAMLTRAGLLDAQHRWTGGKTILVQTGDVTDRGAGVRRALDLLMTLEKQASAAGGKVHVLLGNHEVMNLLGQTTDVSRDLIAEFGGEAPYRAAFGKDGRYGKWLRTKRVLVEIDGNVFMHGGIDLDYTKESLDGINKRAQREIAEWDAGVRWLEDKRLIQPTMGLAEIAGVARAEVERLNALVAENKIPDDAVTIATLLPPVANIGSSSLFHPQGPLWFRGFATWPEAEGAERMAALLKHHDVRRFVTGHTVQPNGRITSRFDGALFLIDTGMLGGKYWPSGRPSALEILPTATNPIYVN